MKRTTLPFFWLAIALIILALGVCTPSDIAVELDHSEVPDIHALRRNNSSYDFCQGKNYFFPFDRPCSF